MKQEININIPNVAFLSQFLSANILCAFYEAVALRVAAGEARTPELEERVLNEVLERWTLIDQKVRQAMKRPLKIQVVSEK